MNASDFFKKKYGNKTTPNDNWVVRFAEEYHQAKLALADVSGSVCADEELQPIECEKHRGCFECPFYVPKQTHR